jgi:ethanolamine utilization protein EutP (predicted NTPase)
VKGDAIMAGTAFTQSIEYNIKKKKERRGLYIEQKAWLMLL